MSLYVHDSRVFLWTLTELISGSKITRMLRFYLFEDSASAIGSIANFHEHLAFCSFRHRLSLAILAQLVKSPSESQFTGAVETSAREW